MVHDDDTSSNHSRSSKRIIRELLELSDKDLRPDTLPKCRWEKESYRDPARTPKRTQRAHEDRASGGQGDRLTAYEWCGYG